MKNKKHNILYSFIIIFTVITIALTVLAVIFKEASLYLLIFALVSITITISLTIKLVSEIRRSRRLDAIKIIQGLDKYKIGESHIIELSNDIPELQEIASNISSLAIQKQIVKNKHVYHNENFIDYVKDHINQEEVMSLAYLYTDKSLDDLDYFIDKFNNVYINELDDNLSLFIVNFANRMNLDKEIRELAKENKDNHFTLIYYPDFDFSEFDELKSRRSALKTVNYVIYNKKDKPYAYSNFYSIVEKATLKKELDMGDFILQSMPYLPYSNIAVTINDEARYFKWSDQQDFLKVPKEDFEYYKKIELYRNDDDVLSVILASHNRLLNLTNEQRMIINTFLNTLTTLCLPTLLKVSKDNIEARINQLLVEQRSFSYTIDENKNIIDASSNLKDKYKDKIVGNKCYKALFSRERECRYCPLNGGSVNKLLASVGTNPYSFTAIDKGNDKEILIIESRHEILGREALEEKLLDHINTDKRGYVMVFKIDYLNDLVLKHKTSKEDIISKFISILKVFALDGNLYRKDEDEFAYVLEATSYVECAEIARKLSFAFEDKIALNDNGVLLTPKIILLSYPLEINSLFALDSLSRTLFKSADKRGKLYRLSTDPIYINRKREYLEIIEQSLKDDLIPLDYENIIDSKNKEIIRRIHFAYLDNSHLPIPEDTITLYAKLENFYFPLLERTFKSINYQKGGQYILDFAKEALDNSLFATILGNLKVLKISPKQIIIESDEIYLRAHPDILNKYSEEGFQFALKNIDLSSKYELPIKVKYARINKAKYLDNKQYALKVLELRNNGVELMFNEDIKGLEGRYKE